MGRLRQLVRRRQALVARSADYRACIAADLEPLARKVAAADRAVATLRAHPVIAAAAAGAIAFMGPRRLLSWGARVLPIYSLLRRL
jgi:hypothetical protein